MKKHLLWLSVAVVVLVAAMHKEVSEITNPAKPVEKSISFAVYKGSNYASDVYNSTSAQVHITIEKVSAKSRTTVWEKTFDAQSLKRDFANSRGRLSARPSTDRRAKSPPQLRRCPQRIRFKVRTIPQSHQCVCCIASSGQAATGPKFARGT